MNYVKSIILLTAIVAFVSCGTKDDSNKEQPVYQDIPYMQDYAVKYYFNKADVVPQNVSADRNGIIQALASNKLYRASNGHFQYPGKLVLDENYTPMTDMTITDLIRYQDQFVYLTDKAVVSNAWAGKLLKKHDIPSANILCGGNDFDFMISDGKKISYLKNNEQLWSGQIELGKIISIKYSKLKNEFLILGEKSLYSFSLENHSLSLIYSGNDLTSFDILERKQNIVIGSNSGFPIIDFNGNIKEENNKLPWNELTSVKEIDGKL
ncbi:MAG: hypothetical protein KAI45_07655, partial [Melioribacteraceae bacterium]|nr:hypothetical protein [Melioribacteraceae bacterium]